MKIFRRDRYLDMIKRKMWNGSVKVITGIRRCGKSFLLTELFTSYLRTTGVKEDHVIFIPLDTESNKELRNPSELNNRLKSLVKDDGEYYVILDEIQYVRDFTDVLNEYLRKKNVDLYVTGSNSRFLSKDVVTGFRGRGDEIRIHPLSFSEYHEASGKDVRTDYNDYVRYGGMPSILSMDDTADRDRYLKNLFAEVYLRDIVERNCIRNDADLALVTDVLCSGIGCLTNPKKIADTLRTVESSTITRPTVVSYIEALEDSFLFEESKRFDLKGRRYIGALSKHYAEDIGLRNARIGFRQMERTHIMENIVYNELRIRGYEVDIGVVKTCVTTDEKKEETYTEIDFVATKNGEKYYIQSALTIADEKKMRQEFDSLLSVRDGFRKIVITGDDIGRNVEDNGIIVIGIYDFLLGNDAF